jgi:hypothetical protein
MEEEKGGKGEKSSYHLPELGEALTLVLPAALVLPLALPIPRVLAQLLHGRGRVSPREGLGPSGARGIRGGNGLADVGHGRVCRAMAGLATGVVVVHRDGV